MDHLSISCTGLRLDSQNGANVLILVEKIIFIGKNPTHTQRFSQAEFTSEAIFILSSSDPHFLLFWGIYYVFIDYFVEALNEIL